jgi:hypothetical protein
LFVYQKLKVLRMKEKKKHIGTKAQIRAIGERERRIATAIFLVFILLVIVFSAYFTYAFLNQSQNPIQNATPKAAIVDQLSLTFPNPTFRENVTNILEQAGYTVDYYHGGKVTVELFGNLPTYGYNIIILRVHSTSHRSLEGETYITPTILFTSEPYSTTTHVSEQLADQVFQVAYTATDSKSYFGIGYNFVCYGMKGTFKNATIIMMGCEGLVSINMAAAFTSKGAKVYFGWDGKVSASHTDQATIDLLTHLVLEKQTIEQAALNTMQEVGLDPTYNSILQYYPTKIGDQTIENINGES